MFASTSYTSFPSKFAVMRGPYALTLRTECVESIMIFESTPSADDSFYTATMRPWQGYIVGDDYMPDKTVRTVKIHSPSRKDRYGRDFSPSNERYMVLPYAVERIIPYVGQSERIPILAFESTNWMPRTHTITTVIHALEGESHMYHYQNIHYIAKELMSREDSASISWLRSLADPYSLANHAEIRAIPYMHISPTNIHNLRRNIIENLYHRTVAANYGALSPIPVEFEEDSIFDGAAGYTTDDADAREEEEPQAEEPSYPSFVYENHLAYEIQKGTECPITFEPLSKMESVAVSPSCGHLFEQEALKAWGKAQLDAGKPIVCPVCRKAVSGILIINNKSYIPPVVTV